MGQSASADRAAGSFDIHAEPARRKAAAQHWLKYRRNLASPDRDVAVHTDGAFGIGRQGGGQISVSMQNQPGGWPPAQHLLLGPQKSSQTPIARSQVVQMGQSASAAQGGGHDSATRQTGLGGLPLRQHSSPVVHVDSQVLVS